MPKASQYNPWLNMNQGSLDIAGNQMNPAVMGQLFSQAAETEQPEDFMAQMLQQSQPPQLMTPMPEAPNKTIQPTTQPLGSLPQEIVPTQPTIASPRQSAMDEYRQMIMNFRGPNNKALLDQLAIGEENYANQLMGQQSEVDKMKEALAKYQQMPQGVDFSALAAFVDSMAGGGGHFGQAAKAIRPETPEERAIKAAEMQRQIAASQGEISKGELEGLKNKLAQMGYADQRQAQVDIAKLGALGNLARTEQSMVNQREAARFDREVQNFEKRIGDMTPGIALKLKRVDELLPGGLEGDDPDVSIPGVGPGMMFVPDFMLSETGSELRQNALSLVQDLIKIQSGVAVSEAEARRKLNERGMGPSSKATSFRRGMKLLKDEIATSLKSKQAGFRPEVVDLYKSRGGLLSDDISAIGKRADDVGVSTPPGNWTPDKQKRLEELRRKKSEGKLGQ